MISYGPIGKIIRAVLTVSLASSIIGCTNAGTVAVQSSRTPVIETPTSTPFYPSTQEIKSPVHTPEISATSEPTSFMFLDSGQKMQYGNLSGDDRQALEYLVGFEENHDLFRPDIDLQGLASLGRYLQNIDSTKADAYLSSSFNPSMLDDAAVFNMGFHGTSPDKLALSADAMKRLGFKPIIFDWAGEEEKKDDSYEFRLDSLSSGMLSEIIQNRANASENGHIVLDNVSEKGFPEYFYRPDFDDTIEEIASFIDSTGKTPVFFYNVHMQLDRDRLAITGWNDTAGIKDIFPKYLLDSTDSIIAIFDTCPESWPEDTEKYLSGYAEKRESEGRPGLDYLVVFGDTARKGMKVPMGGVASGLEIAAYGIESIGGSSLEFPYVTLDSWDSVLKGDVVADKNIVFEKMVVDSNIYSRFTLLGAYSLSHIIGDYGKTWVNTALTSDIVYDDGYQSLSGLNIITNIPYVHEFPIADFYRKD